MLVYYLFILAVLCIWIMGLQHTHIHVSETYWRTITSFPFPHPHPLPPSIPHPFPHPLPALHIPSPSQKIFVRIVSSVWRFLLTLLISRQCDAFYFSLQCDSDAFYFLFSVTLFTFLFSVTLFTFLFFSVMRFTFLFSVTLFTVRGRERGKFYKLIALVPLIIAFFQYEFPLSAEFQCPAVQMVETMVPELQFAGLCQSTHCAVCVLIVMHVCVHTHVCMHVCVCVHMRTSRRL